MVYKDGVYTKKNIYTYITKWGTKKVLLHSNTKWTVTISKLYEINRFVTGIEVYENRYTYRKGKQNKRRKKYIYITNFWVNIPGNIFNAFYDIVFIFLSRLPAYSIKFYLYEKFFYSRYNVTVTGHDPYVISPSTEKCEFLPLLLQITTRYLF